MNGRLFNLAIETSGPVGSITLGRDDQVLESITLRPSAANPSGSAPLAAPAPRSGVELLPAIDHLCQRHAATPRDLAEVYLSTGPGSFTGLRVGVAIAKMLGRLLNTRLVSVPTIEAVAVNATPGVGDPPHLGVCLNVKKKSAYAALFQWDGRRWKALDAPALWVISDLLAHAPRPLMLVGQTLAPQDFPGVTVLPAAMAQPTSDAVWSIGRQMARRGEFTDPLTIQPVYARPPEAVELWNQRHGAAV